MATYVRKLVDADNNTICPATSDKAVYTDDNYTLYEYKSQFMTQLNDLSERIAALES